MWTRLALRTRLVVVFAAVFTLATALVLAVSYALVGEHLRGTLQPGTDGPILADLRRDYALALLGTALLAGGAGWLIAGRLLRPLAAITRATRQVSGDALGTRVALEGPRDELRELADSLDAMLDRVQAAAESQERFVANAGHELRSPLTALRTEVEVTLADPAADEAELRRMAARVLESAGELQELLTGLLLLARGRRAPARQEPVALGPLAREVVGDFAAAAGAAGVVLHAETEAVGATVRGDRPLLRRLIANLVDNGVRYNHAGGRLAVAVTETGGSALLTVTSDGPVIAPADAPRLAEPFERLARHGEGSGLGLSIVRAVAEAHGGTLAIIARPEGGLTVTVRLPPA